MKLLATLSLVVAASCGLSAILLQSHSANYSPKDAHVHSSSSSSSSQSTRSLQQQIQKYSAQDNPKVLNVHVVPHTHDDVGWLKTVEQYYYGLNMTIQPACVENILDSVVDSLLNFPSRTFVYVETKFFSLWWNRQSEAIQESVRGLVQNGQLSFANGGWCMQDEATTHYIGMIDQTSLGHLFLKKELGVIPRVGWQLDPFGHSSTQASLLTSKVGFDALYFGRIDHQDLKLRHDTQECEGLWSSSPSLNTTSFWGLTGSYSGMYGAPKGFCYATTCHDNFLTNMTQQELVDKINLLVQEVKVQSDRTKGNHIMITMGEDFNYQQASTMFSSVDLLIGSLMAFQQWDLIDIPSQFGPRFNRINIFYSSPEYYTDMKYKQTKEARSTDQQSANDEGNVQWSTKSDDFFPYSDCPHCFWAGYFTSRSSFKRFERVSSGFLLAARQIEAFPEPNPVRSNLACNDNCDQPLLDLEDASGVVQHHDAVSGTAKQHVANDYSKRLQAGMDKAAAYVVKKLKRVLVGNSTNSVLDNLSYCQLMNETICEVSQEASHDSGMDIYVVVYNAVGSNKSSIVRLPVSVDAGFDVRRVDNNATIASNIQATPSFLTSSQSTASAEYVLAFNTGPLEPVGATVFRVRRSSSSSNKETKAYASLERLRALKFDKADSLTTQVVANNGLLSAQFDRNTGELVAISTANASLNMSQLWGYYTSYDSAFDKTADGLRDAGQNSSSYIFRPSTPHGNLQVIPYAKGKAEFVNTSMGVEVHVRFGAPWLRQVTRVFQGLPYVEVEYSIGPIPINDGRGKEIITRFSSPISSNETFYTDSNGREFQERRRNCRSTYQLDLHEPVAGNYYPINAAVYVEDESASLSVLVDRSQGGASLVDGSIELMPQRRTLSDDHRGVNEALNETDGGVTPYPPYGKAVRYGNGVVIRGTYRIMVGNGMSGASLSRSEMDESFAHPLVFVASAATEDAPKMRSSFSMLQQGLPPSVMLITFKKLHGNKTNEYMIRLGHQYAVNEHQTLSKPARLDLSQLLAGVKLVSALEMTLSGSEEHNHWVQHRKDWTGSDIRSRSTVTDDNTTVVLQPMEIRTFVVTLEQRESN